MPRLGLGSIDLSATTGGGNSVTGIDDFFFESFTAGQMHPIRTASRTNLVTSSEDFTSDWGVDDVTFDVNSTTAPDGTSTADKIIGSTVSSRHNIVDTGLTNTVTASISVHAKAGELRYLQVASANTANQHANFDLLTGTIGNIGSDFANVAMDSLANGWYRITLTSVGKYNSFYLSLVSGLTASWLESWSMSNNTDGLFLWGAQLEEDGFASAYIPTSGSTVTVSTTLNDTSNVWDFDGTDIMIAEDPESEGFWEESYPDGATLPELVLNGDYEELGSELVANGTFDLGSELVTNGDFSSFTSDNPDNFLVLNEDADNFVTESSGQLRMVSDNSATIAIRANPTDMLTTGNVYQVSVDLTFTSGTLDISGTQFNTSGTKLFYLTAPADYIQLAKASALDVLIDNLSIKEVSWSPQSSWSISSGKANYDAVVSTHYLKQTLSSISAGETVKIQFDISDVAAGKTAFLKLEVSGTPETVFPYTHFSAGTYTFYHKLTSGLDRLNFVPATSSTGGAFSIDNVSVKQVDPNDRWTLGTGWSIEDGKAVGTATTTNLQQLSILEVGTTYELTFTISDYSSGSVKANIGGVNGTTRSSDGTFTEIIGPATTTHFYFDGVSAFTGKIDNVSIKEYAIQPLDI